MTEQDHCDVIALCECAAEAWSNGRYDLAEMWLADALEIIGGQEFVDLDRRQHQEDER